MKKITLAFFAIAGLCGTMLSQPVLTIQAPFANSSSQLRCPNGTNTHGGLKGVYLIKQSELGALTGVNVTALGFALSNGVSGAPVNGNFTVYLQNTPDVSYTKGTSFAAALVGMTPYFTGILPLQNTNTTFTIPLTLSSTFVYGGQGIYVGIEYSVISPFSTQPATYDANLITGGNLGATAQSSVAPSPDGMTMSDFRPAFLFTFSNTATNNIGVFDVTTPGKLAKLAAAPLDITARVHNASIGAVNNIGVGLLVSGANSFPGTHIIPSLAAGASTIVTFSGFNPTTNGLNTVSVGVLPDDYSGDNSSTTTQSVTCNEVAIHPPFAAGVYTSQGYGAGASTSGLIYSFRYSVPTNCNLTGVKVVIPGFSNAANLGKQIFAVLQDNTGAIVATGNTVTITGAMLDQFSTHTFPSAPAMVSGQDYNIGIGMPANAYFPIGNTAFTAAPVPGYFSSPITGGSYNALVVGHLSLEGVLGFSGYDITVVPSKTAVCKSSPQTVTITATGADTYTWSSGLGNGSTVTLTPSGSGTATQVSVQGGFTTAAAAGCKSAQSNVTFTLLACTGLSNNTANDAVKLFPNPTVSGKTIVTGLSGENTITVYNTLGQVVLNQNTNSDTATIDISAYPVGNYMVKITDSSRESRIIKIVNQN